MSEHTPLFTPDMATNSELANIVMLRANLQSDKYMQELVRRFRAITETVPGFLKTEDADVDYKERWNKLRDDLTDYANDLDVLMKEEGRNMDDWMDQLIDLTLKLRLRMLNESDY